MAPKYKLSYFPLRGLGEPIRFLLAYSGADFEDNRIDFKDWPALKNNSPFGKMPFIEFDGKVLCQSAVISRYLGKKAGLGGADEYEDALIDQAVDSLRDLVTELGNWFREENPEAKAKKWEKVMNETIPFFFGRFDKLVKDNDGYIANKKLSWGDIYFAAVFEFLLELGDQPIDPAAYPNLANLYKKVFSIPSIKAWVDKRPKDTPRN